MFSIHNTKNIEINNVEFKNNTKYDDMLHIVYSNNINLNKLLSFHESHKKLVTISAVRPAARFGELEIKGSVVTSFKEKPQVRTGWINGGFFVFETKIFDYLSDGDMTVLEKSPLETLAKEQRLTAYKHTDFWHPMDTLRDKNYLESLWTTQKAPWKIWS